MPLSINELLIGFAKDLLSESEKDQLDAWICENEENQKTFEQFIETRMPTKRVYDLLIGHAKRTNTDEEEVELYDWTSLNEFNRRLVTQMPKTNDMEQVYYFLVKILSREEAKQELN